MKVIVSEETRKEILTDLLQAAEDEVSALEHALSVDWYAVSQYDIAKAQCKVENLKAELEAV